jgi:hypothetical protein
MTLIEEVDKFLKHNHGKGNEVQASHSRGQDLMVTGQAFKAAHPGK